MSFHGLASPAERAAYEQGRREGLEEAEKICRERARIWRHDKPSINTALGMRTEARTQECDEILKAIRALIEDPS